MILFCYKVIDEDADIRLGTVKNYCTLLLQLSRRIDTGHKSLNCCLLIS